MALPKDFKPEEGNAGKYTLSKLKSGEKAKVRILSDFAVGRSVWGDLEGKRVCTRVHMNEPMPTAAIGINKFSGKPETVKQFVAAVVWNYVTKQVEILETDKSTIINQIFEIEANEDWGDSKGFDLTIAKKGEGMETEYSVLPSNKAVFKSPEEWKDVNLEALYTQDDPFAKSENVDAGHVSNDIPF